MITSYFYLNTAISILTVVVLFFHLMELDIISQHSINKLKRIGFLIILQVLIDTLFKTYEGTEITSILYFIKALEFMLNPVLPLMIASLFINNNYHHHSNTSLKMLHKIQIGIIILNTVCQFASLFCKFIFIIDENNIYQRTNYTYIYMVLLFSSIMITLIIMIVFSNAVQNINRKTLCGILVTFIVGYIIRIVAPNTNYDWLCVSIAYILIDIYFVNLGLRLDPLTQLLNRQVYQKLIERINFTTLTIIIDANNFKSINDTYGHECGDKTLRSFAKCILKVYGEYAWCFRIGGDEFCVILKPKMFNALAESTIKNDVHAMAKNLMAKLDEVIQDRATQDDNNCLSYGVSQGYAIYYDPSEHPTIKNHLSFKQVLKRADTSMYRKKKEFKKNHSAQKMQSNGNKPNPELIEGSENFKSS